MTLAPAAAREKTPVRPVLSGLPPSTGSRRLVLPPFIAFLLLVDLALCLVYLGNFALPLPSGTFLRLVDIDGETSIANWYSSVKLFCVGALFALFAVRNFDRANVFSWPLLLFPALFLALSADEAVQIHEWLGRKTDVLLPGGDREGTMFYMTGIWMFVLGIPFFAFVIGLVYCTRRFLLPVPGVTLKLVLGTAIFLGGAIGAESFTNYFSDLESLGFHLEVFAEELLEMAGITVIFWALLDLLSANGFSLHLDPAR